MDNEKQTYTRDEVIALLDVCHMEYQNQIAEIRASLPVVKTLTEEEVKAHLAASLQQ